MWSYPRMVAHRGGGVLAPENTLAGMRCALEHGFRAVEFDVMLAKEDVPVVMHDLELGRTVAKKGRVADFYAQELSAFDAGSWFSPAFIGEPVPTCEEVVHFCMQHDIWMNIEIKPAPGSEEKTGRVVGQLMQRLFTSELDSSATLPLFSSFSYAALDTVRCVAPLFPRGLLVEKIPADWHAQLCQLGAVSLHASHCHITPEQVRMVKEAGLGLFCYTVNNPVRARHLLQWGVDGLCTDRLDVIGAQFATRCGRRCL